VHANVRIPDRRFDPQLRSQRRRQDSRRLDGMGPWRRRAGEREGNGVLCRLTFVQTCGAPGAARRRPVVVMGGQPMLVLGMLVIPVDVGMQRKRHARRGDQRRDEQQRQDAVHTEECMQRPHVGQNDDEGETVRIGR
jgi:hypothetical protein